MIYRKNIGGLEQGARVAAGIAMIAGGLIWLPGSMPGYAVAASGAVAILTGLFGFCPACALVGRKLDRNAP
jgi:hypothetical protein